MQADKNDILLIEGNYFEAQLTKRILRRHFTHAGIIHIESGDKALDFLFERAGSHTCTIKALPKMILLIVNLPKVSGLEVLRQLKESDQTKDIPVAMLVSFIDAPTTRAAVDLGCDHCIVKPINFDEFSSSLAELAMSYGMAEQQLRSCG